MTRKTVMLMIVAPALAWVMWAPGAEEKTHKLTTISPHKMADSLHEVIAADQQAYAELVARRLQSGDQRVAADENPPDVDDLPVHARMLRAASQDIQKHGAEFSYTLRSPWPINENNGPQTQVEQTGLEFVASHSGENYYAEEELGGRSYFTAVYADRATLSSCIECHNQHPRSPRHDLKPGDVMGAIVVRVPLEF
jgi:Protein of unknown function (DUF3365)